MSYLLMPTPEAISRVIMSGVSNPDVEYKHLHVGLPVAVDGTLTRVSVAVNPSAAPVNLWAFSEPMDFHYHRYDIEFLMGEVRMAVASDSFPVFTTEILHRITERTGIPFSHDDFINSVFTTHGTFTLEANPYSLKWVGSVPLILE